MSSKYVLDFLSQTHTHTHTHTHTEREREREREKETNMIDRITSLPEIISTRS